MLTLLSFLKFGKLAATVGTMLLSVAVYALAFGWRYAAGFIALIFVHELGHYIAARQRGLSVGAPIFIPFVGAYITLKDQPHDVETEAYVAIAGPIVGAFGAFAAYYLARSEDSVLLLAISYADSSSTCSIFCRSRRSTADASRRSSVRVSGYSAPR